MALTADTVRAVANFDAPTIPTIQGALGTLADSVAGAGGTVVGSEAFISISLPDAATTDYDFILPEKLELIEMQVIKTGAGAGNTIQVKNGAGTAISDAVAAAVADTSTRSSTMAVATRVLAAGATMRLTNTRAAGTSAALVMIRAIRRA